MTQQFRIALFIALAGMVGLHVRPCVGCALDAVFARAAATYEVIAASTPVAIVKAAPSAAHDTVTEGREKNVEEEERPALRTLAVSARVKGAAQALVGGH